MEELIEEKEAIKYFFDSYAVIEILKENSSYKRFIKESVTLTIFKSWYPETVITPIYLFYLKYI